MYLSGTQDFFWTMDRINTHISIAIDGPSSSGKSSLAKAIAKRLDYLYLDTGAMYRAVTLYCLSRGIDMEEEVQEEILDSIHIDFKYDQGAYLINLNDVDVSEDIRRPEVSDMVSEIAAIPQVRERLVKLQREISNDKNIVMDGRDIGSVVLPDATLKFFIKASIDLRAKRRYEELLAKGLDNVSLVDVANNLKKRDHIDSTRTHAPLIQCDDAIVVENDGDFNATLEAMLSKISTVTSGLS